MCIWVQGIPVMWNHKAGSMPGKKASEKKQSGQGEE